MYLRIILMKYGLLILLFIYALPLLAKHQHHEYVGYHGMALMVVNDQVLAYHLPLYVKPHDFQLLYEVELDSKLKSQIATQKMITILPEKFDLTLLIKGETLVLKSKVFNGHFERGGKQIFETDIMFKSQLYKNKIGHEYEREVFDMVSLDAHEPLYIHRINTRPSFDLIVQGHAQHKSKTISCEKVIDNGKSNVHQLTQMEACVSGKSLYFEYLDFQ